MVFVLGEDLDFGFNLVFDLTLTFGFACLLVLALALTFTFAFTRVAFFVVARRADVFDLLEAERLDLPATLFTAGLLLLETRFLLVVFFFGFVVPLIF